jgi:GT2 family glycosyltransferase
VSTPDLAVCIVNWNTRELLTECLDYLAQAEPSRPAVMVLDNGSTDGSAQRVRERFPDVQLIESPSNLGFAGGVNRLLEATSADFAFLLNTDARPEPGAIGLLRDYLRTHPKVAAVGPLLVTQTGTPLGCHDRFPTLLTELIALAGRHRVPVHERVRDDVDWIGGASMMLASGAVRDVGLLDESYFMYYEETDWCHRARQRGWQIACLPDARVTHFVGGSGGVARRAQLSRSRIRFQRRYGSPTRALVLALTLFVWYRLAWLIWAVRTGPRSDRPRSYALASGVARLALKELPQ